MSSSRVSRLVALSAASRRQRAASERHCLGLPIMTPPPCLQAGVLKLSATGACCCYVTGDLPRMRPSQADSQSYSQVLFGSGGAVTGFRQIRFVEEFALGNLTRGLDPQLGNRLFAIASR